MKKIVIPAILAATILVAGMFAFMPVQKASTVHTSIGVLNVASGTADATGATFANIVAPSSTIKNGSVRALTFTDAGTADTLAVSVCLDATCTSTATIIAETAPNTEAHWTGFGLRLTGSTTADADTVGFIVSWRAK